MAKSSKLQKAGGVLGTYKGGVDSTAISLKALANTYDKVTLSQQNWGGEALKIGIAGYDYNYAGTTVSYVLAKLCPEDKEQLTRIEDMLKEFVKKEKVVQLHVG